MSSVIWSSSTAHSGWALAQRAEAPEARDVVGVDDLDVGEVRPRVGPAVRLAGRLDGVERVADGPVAERVEVRLEPERVEPDDGGLSVSASMKSSPELSVAWPWTSKYGLEHRGGAVLDDPVAHELDARRRVAAEDAVRPPLDELVDLLEPRVRSHHSAPTTRAVSSPDAASARYAAWSAGLDPGVLPGGDPEAVQVALCLEQAPWRYSASLVSGTSGPTRSIAPSWSVPSGEPSGSRAIRPETGSGVSAVMPAQLERRGC